ncbi:hypothetical protein [Rodentibacter pneumotropicus]|uniref:Mu-like prophage FluMu N-terminal domain-containing protein n=1 Tax=Rodentibacter pneumotropicus TaxID=758 RepID=A0A4S2Q333_9PAST|nr:hypothetical protein [Rodentibacter pneumotropicus]THA10494.1 hypothetical protein D3M78_03050 [Rodentibacter pneumotropicus]
MARKNQKNETGDVKAGDSVKDETLQNTSETARTLTDESSHKEEESDDVTEPAEENDTAPPKPEGHVIAPIAYAVKLRSIHPQPSYGRCGYRFSKEGAVEIPAGDLTGEQVVTLAEDPWLELVPICEE